MKKLTVILCTVFTLVYVFSLGGQAFYKEAKMVERNGVSVINLDTTNNQGVITLIGKTQEEKIKIRLLKEDKQIWLDVEVKDGEFHEEIWLTEGKGSYEVAIMIHQYDRKYKFGPRFNVENKAEVNRFLVPTKDIQSNHKDIRNLAQEITDGIEGDRAKAEAIYDWVTRNIEYDYSKYDNHKVGNYDNPYGSVHTLETKQGVCYDYAVLTAALGRASGLQVKVVRGEGINGSYRGLHAWNEVYIADENKWINVDTTFGALSEKKYFDNHDFNESHIKEDEY